MKKSLAVIGYSSEQDGVVLLARNYCVPREKFQYNKSFIDQTCSVKISGYWPRSFFVILWTSTLSRSINIQKKRTNQYQVVLTSSLVKPIFIMIYYGWLIIVFHHLAWLGLLMASIKESYIRHITLKKKIKFVIFPQGPTGFVLQSKYRAFFV